jgi:hypothetical protein
MPAGCADPPPAKRTGGDAARPVPAGWTPSASEPPSPPSRGSADAAPYAAPPALAPEAEKGEKGARHLLLSWARAIEHREFDQAWAMLSPADRGNWKRGEFVGAFANLGKITVEVPGGTLEGAAGSLYYASPVTIIATDREGRPVRFEGEAILRRVNDVEGASPAQLRWHFERLTLERTP